MVESYTLINGVFLQEREFLTGDEVTFDETLGEVRIKHIPFMGFRDRQGELHAYDDEACANSVRLDTTLNPKVLEGAKILKIQGMKAGSEKVMIYTDRGILTMWHQQECCEHIDLVDVTGKPEDLIGGVIGVFEVRSGTVSGKKQKGSGRKKPTAEDRFAWRTYTFYEIRTSNRGDVTLRWGEPDNHDDNRYGEGITLTLQETK